jgi:hypothetical protein
VLTGFQPAPRDAPAQVTKPLAPRLLQSKLPSMAGLDPAIHARRKSNHTASIERYSVCSRVSSFQQQQCARGSMPVLGNPRCIEMALRGFY